VAAAAFALVALTLAAVPAGAITSAGTLSRFAGTGAQPGGSPGPALSFGLNVPSDLAVDSVRNLYVADTYNDRVEKITPAGQLGYFAGTGVSGTGTAGLATSSMLHSPGGVAVDSSNNVYIADTGNHRVVKVDGVGQLSFVAGTGISGTPTPGAATAVKLMSPAGLAFDAADNLYIADTEAKRVLKVDSGTQNLTILAGNGGSGPPADNATATAVGIGMPADVAVDAANAVHVSVPAAGIVFKVASGALTVEAGGGVGVCPGTLSPGTAVGQTLCEPTGLAYAGGALYIAAAGNNRLVRLDSGNLSYAAGDGTDGNSYGSPATTRQIGAVTAVTMGADGVGYLSAALTQSTITRYSLNVETVPGPPTGISGAPGDQQATVGWTAPLDNGGAPISGYQVRLSPTTQGAGQPVTKTVDGSTTSTIVGSLTNGSAYTVTVAAMNPAGTGPASTEVVTVTPINLAASVTASQLAGEIHVGGPMVTLPLWAMLDKPRSTVGVTLVSLVVERTVASNPMARSAAGTEFSGMLVFRDDDVPAWGAAQWVLRPESPSNTGTVSTSLRLHSLLGLGAVRAGEWIMVSGSARAYHSVLNTYKPWNARPVLVQRWNGQSWTTLQTVDTDPNGNFATSLRIPWKVGIRLVTDDTTKIWGATSLTQAL
jgi:hypothetical protein